MNEVEDGVTHVSDVVRVLEVSILMKVSSIFSYLSVSNWRDVYFDFVKQDDDYDDVPIVSINVQKEEKSFLCLNDDEVTVVSFMLFYFSIVKILVLS